MRQFRLHSFLYVSIRRGDETSPEKSGLVLLWLFAFLAFGGDSLGGRDGPLGCLADAFGALAFAVFVAAPCRAVVEFHEGRPVEAFVRHFAEIGDFRTGFGLDLSFELAARRGGFVAGGRGGLCRGGRFLPADGFFRGRGVFLSADVGRFRAPGFAGCGFLAVAGDFGYRPAAPVQAVELADDLFGIVERHAHEREVVRDLDVVDVFVAQGALELEHIDQLARRVAVASAHGEEQPRRAFAVHRERTDFGVVALVEFAAERQTQ